MPNRTLFVALAGAALVMLSPLRVAADPVISPGTPIPVDAGPPELFALPIDIAGAVALVTWQFDLSFDPAVVQVNVDCNSDTFVPDQYCDLINGPVTEGSFTSSNGSFLTLFVPGVADNINGLVSIVAGGYLDVPPGPSGDGTLAFVEFYWVDPENHGDPMFSVENASATSSVPEPATLALFAGALLLLGYRSLAEGRRRK